MVRFIVKINLFKHGLFWHACCEIPTEDSEVFYFDNEPYTTIKSLETLHCVGLTYEQANRKIVNKLKQLLKSKGETDVI